MIYETSVIKCKYIRIARRVGSKAYLHPVKERILFAGDVTRGQQSVTPRNLYSYKAWKQRETSVELGTGVTTAFPCSCGY